MTNLQNCSAVSYQLGLPARYTVSDTALYFWKYDAVCVSPTEQSISLFDDLHICGHKAFCTMFLYLITPYVHTKLI